MTPAPEAAFHTESGLKSSFYTKTNDFRGKDLFPLAFTREMENKNKDSDNRKEIEKGKEK